MSAPDFTLTGHIVNIESQEVFPGKISIQNGIIQAVTRLDQVDPGSPYYLPGLVDAHIHIESSMMVPQEFARLAVSHGGVAALCDPHETANVLGVEGIDFMVRNGGNSRFNFYFGLPSCVPSSPLETAGAVIDAEMTRQLIQREDLHFLAEMMNFPGVLHDDPSVLAKLEAAKQAGKVIDGHAPGVRGEELKKYRAAGVSTDHECTGLDEALEKIREGMMIQIREGSAARNFEALYPLLNEYPDRVMFCSDDLHPDDLQRRHIDELIRRGQQKGISIWNLLQAACVNPVRHYAIGSGLMHVGDPATFIAVNSLSEFIIDSTYIDGYQVYNKTTGINTSNLKIQDLPAEPLNNFKAAPICTEQIRVHFTAAKVKVIQVFDGELYTACRTVPVAEVHAPDIQKVVVYNRYGNGRPQVGYISGFGLKRGAIGASIAHDSHNLVAIGTTDEAIVKMVNSLIECRGGVGLVDGERVDILPLPVAGLMSDRPAEEIADAYHSLRSQVKELGSPLESPFITMSFLSLPVIPELKLTDRGLVDFSRFDFTDLMA